VNALNLSENMLIITNKNLTYMNILRKGYNNIIANKLSQNEIIAKI